jgi:hypothetical protein
VSEVAAVIRRLVDGVTTWDAVAAKYPAVAKAATEEA